jgi:hypothetical protein
MLMPLAIAPHYDVGQYLEELLNKTLTCGQELFWEKTKAEKGILVEQEQEWQTCSKVGCMCALRGSEIDRTEGAFVCRERTGIFSCILY